MNDEGYKTLVYMNDAAGMLMLCFTDAQQPDIYDDSATAELRRIDLQNRWPGYTYGTLDFKVL